MVAGPEGDQGQDAAGKFRFLDRSHVRVLLCDNDAKSSHEVLQLLRKCFYQVTSVRTARQVIDALNAQGPDIDLILAEVDLPITKGLKMLKYVVRNKELIRIPIIMMSSKGDMSVVGKCLQLGAADYLVKPLRTNELLNLWTHVWRRRRMLGLSEKDVLGHDVVVSDLSDANMNSTAFISDDMDDKSRTTNCPEMSVSYHPNVEPNVSNLLRMHNNSPESQQNNSEDGSHGGHFFSWPRKTDLKVGESSAFLTYVRSNAPTSNSYSNLSAKNAIPPGPISCQKNLHLGVSGDAEKYDSIGANEGYSHERCTASNAFPIPSEFHSTPFSSANEHERAGNHSQLDASNVPTMFSLPLCIPRMMDQNMVSSSLQLYQTSVNDVQEHGTPAVVRHYNVLPHCHMSMMPSYPYYQSMGLNLQQGHMTATHVWSKTSSSSKPEVKSGRAERREAALVKFRQKRKDRCFAKKIRYVNRKRFAEKRPRVRGQFVRQESRVCADFNEFPSTNAKSKIMKNLHPGCLILVLLLSTIHLNFDSCGQYDLVLPYNFFYICFHIGSVRQGLCSSGNFAGFDIATNTKMVEVAKQDFCERSSFVPQNTLAFHL